MGRGSGKDQATVSPLSRGSASGQAEALTAERDEMLVTMQQTPREYLDRRLGFSFGPEAEDVKGLIRSYGQTMLGQDDETIIASLTAGINRFTDAFEETPVGVKGAMSQIFARGEKRKKLDNQNEEMLTASVQIKVCGDIARQRGLLPA